MLLKILEHLLYAAGILFRVGPRSAQHRTAGTVDILDVLEQQGRRLAVVEQAGPTAPDADHFHPITVCGDNKCPNYRVEPGRISAAGQNSELSYAHLHIPYQRIS